MRKALSQLNPETISAITSIRLPPVNLFGGGKGIIYGLAVDENYVYTAEDAGTVGVWEKGTGRKVATLEGHSSSVRAVAVDDRFIYSGSDDGTVSVYGLVV